VRQAHPLRFPLLVILLALYTSDSGREAKATRCCGERETGNIICSRWIKLPSEFSDTVVGFEVLTAVVMKSSIFWDITPCSLLKINLKSSISWE
jgi:hypothetical protein